MTAFNRTHLIELKSSIAAMGEKVYRTAYKPPVITPEQVVDLLAPPEDRELLKRAPHVANIDSYYTHASTTITLPTGTDVEITVAKMQVLLPKEPKLQPDADKTVLDAITQWVTQQREVARDFGRVQLVLDQLNDLCTSKQQLRYLFPSIVAICKANSDLQSLANELAVFKPTRNAPTISPDLRVALEQAAVTITTAMFAEGSDERWWRDRDFPVMFNGPKCEQFVEGFGRFGGIYL